MTEEPANERRSTERLLADAEERLRITGNLPERLEQARGWAVNDGQNIRVTVDVHGALSKLELLDSALSMSPQQLGQEIVRAAGQAQRGALLQGVNELGTALGDAATLNLMASSGLADLVEPDAEVIPYTPGVDPNAHRWNVID